MKQLTFIYVLNKKGKPLMPTTRCGHVRKLLKKGLAVPVKSNPFTIKLKYETPDITQNLYLGIDSGRENIGLAVSDENGNCIFLSELKTNNKTIKSNMKDRASHRSSRRQHRRQRKQRKALSNSFEIKNGTGDILRSKKECKSIKISYPGMEESITHKVIKGKEAKFNNRKRDETWLTPSAKQLIQMHVLAMRNISKILPITNITLERVSFDFQKLENTDIKAWEYSKGPLYGFKSYKDYINEFQHHKCLLCEINNIEYYHHIVQRKDGGTDNINNIAGLCYECHYGKNGVHNLKESSDRLLELKSGLKSKYSVSLLNSVIPTLIEELDNYCNTNNIKFNITDGLTTYNTRKALKLTKTHAIDAYCISLAERNILIASKLPKLKYSKQRFKKKSKNIINALNKREYYLNNKLVAINRHKATDQKQNSLEEFMEEYNLTHTKKECDRLFHSLIIKPAKRTYTYHKKKLIAPIHTGDIVKYEKHNKIKGNTKTLVFVATGISMSINKVEEGTKNKDFKYCKRIESGCIPFINKYELII